MEPTSSSGMPAGGSAWSDSAMLVHRSRILVQSSTASRTLPSTVRSRTEISSRSAAALIRSISRCIQDSVTTPNSVSAGWSA